MAQSPFKRSSLTEMCKQVCSAPVIFKKKDGTECLAFYNNEDCIQATKLYIIFPDSSFPKYIEGNDLYELRKCVIHEVSYSKANELYHRANNKYNANTKECFEKLIAKLSILKMDSKVEEALKTVANKIKTSSYNKLHAVALVKKGPTTTLAVLKNLKGNTALEGYIEDEEVQYNVTFDEVYWAVGISAVEYTEFCKSLQIV